LFDILIGLTLFISGSMGIGQVVSFDIPDWFVILLLFLYLISFFLLFI